MVTLYKALRATVNGADLERRGLDASDDPYGYTGTPGTSGKGGAYFTVDPSLAVGLVPLPGYGNGILVVTLPQGDYDAMEAAGQILPDIFHPTNSVRIMPSGFTALNPATAPPLGQRRHCAAGLTLPGGQTVPA